LRTAENLQFSAAKAPCCVTNSSLQTEDLPEPLVGCPW
jgi:hypothetical protein